MENIPILPDERLDEVNERLSLISKRRGLTLSTDAYLLSAFARPAPRGVAVELGTGTGIVSLLSAAKGRFSHIHAVEIQPDFADLARRNVTLNGLGNKITVHGLDLRQLRPERLGGEVEAVLANPPYMRTDSGKRNDDDYQYIARHEVCGDLSDFCAAAARLLKHGGRFTCVYLPERLTDLMAALRERRLEPKRMVLVHADEKSEPSSVLIEARKGGAPGMRILPPLLLHESGWDGKVSRPLSPRAARIYETMSFEDEIKERSNVWSISSES